MQAGRLGPMEPLLLLAFRGRAKLGRELLNMGTPVVDFSLKDLTV